jgi:prepilin-type N-terminal cleavage/methylation domain-containing protein
MTTTQFGYAFLAGSWNGRRDPVRTEDGRMYRNQKKYGKARTQRGFSLIELMVTLVILTTVVGIATDGIMQVEKKSASDVNKVGVAQESRQFMDQILRDLRQCGYPGLGLFDPATGATSSSSYVAQGLINFICTGI